MFLRIAKHNIHMKTEFSIYKKLDRLDATFEFSLNPIRKVILNVLHTFFADFTNKNIYVYVSEFNGRVKIAITLDTAVILTDNAVFPFATHSKVVRNHVYFHSGRAPPLHYMVGIGPCFPN